MFKFITIAGIAAAAFMLPPMASAATDPGAPAGIVASVGSAASDSNLRNIILDHPDHRDDALGKNNNRTGNNSYEGNSGARGRSAGVPPGGSPTPEPSSLILFAVGLSGLILLESRRTAAKRDAETDSNS